jgi:hypothetical protein
VNALLVRLLKEIRSLLGKGLVGMYLDGSLASGDFDAASDIDFLVVTNEEVTDALFRSLRAMHERIAREYPRWGVELEGSYIPRAAVRRYDPAFSTHPNLERGRQERLKRKVHDEDWLVHYHVVRERGIPLFGPEPKTLIDPVAPEALRTAMSDTLEKWWKPFLADPALLTRSGYPSYTVLTLCRMCYTLATGKIASKTDAARWAKAHLDSRWAPLINAALENRLHPPRETDPAEIARTQDFIRYVLEHTGRVRVPRKDIP